MSDIGPSPPRALKAPVFPLPSTVLFPSTWLPLYVFELRYREMLADVMASDHRLAIALMREGWETAPEPVPIHEVVGLGEVESCRSNADGTSHIVVKGLSRARVLSVERWVPYRVASLELVADYPDEFPGRAGLHHRLHQLLERKLRLASSYPESQDVQLTQMSDSGVLTDVAAFFSDLAPVEKQFFLELLDVRSRLERLAPVLEREVLKLESRN